MSNPTTNVAAAEKPELGFLDRHDFLLRRLHSLTGIVPIGVFLISHLTTNSSLVWGKLDSRAQLHAGDGGHPGVATFQHEVNFIHSIPFLLLIEITLWVSLGFHSLYGLYIATTGRSNLNKYKLNGNARYALQRISGYVGILFIFYHVATLRWGWTWLVPGGTAWRADFAASTMAAAIRGGAEFSGMGFAVALFYLLGVTMLVFHFANGLWTAAITWGVTISRSAQKRWGYVCAALGVGLMGMAWSAVIAFATLDQKQAQATEKHLQPVKAVEAGRH